jgi:hypothetical protein
VRAGKAAYHCGMFRRFLPLLVACSQPLRPAAPPQCAAPAPVLEVATAERAPVHGLRNIQRTMRLLETSSAAQPNRVRILFYGQSITQSAWSRQVAAHLHTRYPHARLEIQNRALGGFSSERLAESAETDLYPWQPDLVVFHVYGAHDRYEDIVRQLRATTSAELLLQTDHVTDPRDLHEPLAPCANPPDAAHWSGFMNQAFLPSLVARHQVALCDLRTSWKLYLERERLPPSALLSDQVHLNAQGDQRMAALVESCLRYQPALGDSPAEDWVETVAATPRLGFRGYRIDATVGPGGSVRVRIDGEAPSRLPSLYRFARAHVRGGDKWPPLHGLDSRSPLLLETFTFALRRSGDAFLFDVTGSRSGDEGSGSTDAPFESRSGRLLIAPTNWDIAYAFELAGQPVPATFEVELRVEPHFVDTFAGTAEGERTITLASGLAAGAHLLELDGDLSTVRSLTVHRAREEF